MSYLHYMLLILLIPSFISARKVKRKGYYHPYPPPGPPPQPHTQQSSSASAEPYQFEEIRVDNYGHSPHEPTHQQEHYGHDHYEQQDRYGQQDHYGQQQHHAQQEQGHQDHHVHHYTHSSVGSKFIIDNGLRSIAQGSADQANSAVASQNAAGKQAAYVAKNTLAQSATQAAGTAVAVLKGKEVLLHRLEEQNIETQKALQAELQQLQQAKRSAKAAQYSAQQALNHVSVLTAALNNAQSASELAQKSASEAAAELASQIDMVAQAKTKMEQIESHLYTARLDYEETKEAAEKATHSAQEAQLNANDAALHANVELQSESTAADSSSASSSSSSSLAQAHFQEKSDSAQAIVKRRHNNEKVNTQ